MILLSQNDPLWKLKKLGFGDGTIGNYGCLITCLSMIWDRTPIEVNDWLKNNDGYVNLNLVIWTSVPGFEWRGWVYDDVKVKETITKYGFCIVETDFNDNPKDGSHFVVAIGNGKIYDPWDGKEKPISSYQSFYGYAIMNPDNNPLEGNMPDGTITITTDRHDYLIGRAVVSKETATYLDIEGDPDQVSLERVKKSIDGLRSRATQMENEKGVAEANLKKALEDISTLEGRVLEKEGIIKARDTELTTATRIGLEKDGRIQGLIGENQTLMIENSELKTQREYDIKLRVGDYAIIKYKKVK